MAVVVNSFIFPFLNSAVTDFDPKTRETFAFRHIKEFEVQSNLFFFFSIRNISAKMSEYIFRKNNNKIIILIRKAMVDKIV